MATTQQTCSVKCESYANSIIPRIYEHLIRGTLGDVVLSAEGKFIRAHKLILSISSDYFEVSRVLVSVGYSSTYCLPSQSIFNVANMDKPVIVIGNLKFADLCLILDFAYLGQSQVPSDRLDDFLRAGEMLQIRGIKEGRIHYLNNVHQTTTVNRSVDSTISSTQETFNEPVAKRARDDDDISIQEASEIMKMLLESTNEMDNHKLNQTQVKSTPAPLTGKPSAFFIARGPNAPRTTNSSPPRPKSGKKIISEKPKLLCRFCSRALTTQGRIKKHENECADNPNREIAICNICNIQLKPSSLSLHKNTKHKPMQNSSAPSKSNNESLMIAAQVGLLPIINAPPPAPNATSPKEPIETVELTEITALFGLPIQVEERELGSDNVTPARKDSENELKIDESQAKEDEAIR